MATIPPPPGQMIDVGGYRLHVQCSGTGRPTVVLDSGLAGNSLFWATTLPEISNFAQACAIDRAGYAWSDPGPADLPRTSSQIVQEFRTLMRVLGNEPPYVLVGHSFGGINMLVWAHQYPDEVAGLVLVDSSHPEMWQRVKQIPPPKTVRRGFQFFVALGRIGLLRWVAPLVVGRLLGEGKNVMPQPALSAFAAFARQRKEYENAVREADVGDTSFAEAQTNPGELGDLPLVVLDSDWWRKGKQTPLKVGSVPLREDKLSWSSRSHEMIAEGCDHANLPIVRPEKVAQAVRWVIDQDAS